MRYHQTRNDSYKRDSDKNELYTHIFSNVCQKSKSPKSGENKCAIKPDCFARKLQKQSGCQNVSRVAVVWWSISRVGRRQYKSHISILRSFSHFCLQKLHIGSIFFLMPHCYDRKPLASFSKVDVKHA